MDRFVRYVKSKLMKGPVVEEEITKINEAMAKTREYILQKAVNSFGPSPFTHIMNANENVYYSSYSGNISCYNLASVKMIEDSFFPLKVEKFVIDCGLFGIVANGEFKLFSYPEANSLYSESLKILHVQTGIYTSSDKGEIHHWSAERSTLIYKDPEPVPCFHISDSILILSGKSLKIINRADNSELFVSAENHYTQLEVSSKYIVCTHQSAIHIYDIEKYELIKELSCGQTTSISISKDSNFLAVGTKNKEIWVYDLAKGRDAILMSGHSKAVIKVLISDDINYITSISEDETFRIWNFPEFPEEEILFSDSKINVIHFYGIDLVICKGDHKTYLYTDELRKLFDMKALGMSASSANNFLSVGDELGNIYLYDIDKSDVVLSMKGHNGAVRGMAILDKKLITGGADSEIYIWNLLDACEFDAEKIEKVGLIGHQQAIRKIELCGDFLVSGSADNTVKIWDLNEMKEMISISCSVNTLAVKEILVTGDSEGELKIWNLYDFDLESSIAAHSDLVNTIQIVQQYIFSSSVDGSICIVLVPYRVVILKLDFRSPITSLQVKESQIIIGGLKKLVIKKNLLFQEKFAVVGPQDLTQNFLAYVKDVYLSRSPKPDLLMDEFLILPYFVNTVHIYTYLTLNSYLSLSLDNYSPLIAQPFSPFCYAVYCDFKSIRTILLSNIINSGESNPYIFKLVEKHLIKLNNAGLFEVFDLYESAYVAAKRKYLPTNCASDYRLPVYKAAPYQRIQKEDFFEEEDLVKGRTLMFKENYIGIEMNMGSNNSIDFLESLAKCKNPEILRAAFVQDMVKYKWEVAKYPMFTQAFMFYVYLITFAMYLTVFRRDIYCLSVLFAANLLLSVYEAYQMAVFKKYINGVWNLVDWSRLFCFFLYVIPEFMYLIYGEEIESEYIGYALDLLVITSCIKGISYFRIFSLTRYLIRLIQESFMCVMGYLVYLSYFIVTFALISYLNEIKRSLKTGEEPRAKIMHIYETYEIALGTFYKQQDYNLAQWTMLTVISLILCVIIFNIMISIIGDTFEKVQTDALSADTQEMLDMIIEVENMYFTRRQHNKVLYFQLVDDFFKDEFDSWEGRIRHVTRIMTRTSAKERKQIKDQIEEISMMGKGIVSLDEKLVALQKIVDKEE